MVWFQCSLLILQYLDNECFHKRCEEYLPVESWKHYWHDDLVILLYQRHDILVIPEVESPLRHLNSHNHNGPHGEVSIPGSVGWRHTWQSA